MSSTPSNGGMPARRAVVRWASRGFRRDWRQHLLILSLLTVAIVAAVGFSCAAFNVAPVPGQSEFGDANHWFRFNDPDPATLQPKLDAATAWFGEIDAIGHRPVPLPGTGEADRLPLDSSPTARSASRCCVCVSGRYPVADDEVAVTNSVAEDVGTSIGSTIDLDGVSRNVVGIVENPSKLGDDFVLLPPSALAQSKYVTMLIDASEGRVNDFRPPGDTGRILSGRGDLPEDVLAAVLILVVSTLVLALVALDCDLELHGDRAAPAPAARDDVGDRRDGEAPPAHDARHRRGHRCRGRCHRHGGGLGGMDRGRAECEQRGRSPSGCVQHPLVAAHRGGAARGDGRDRGGVVARPHDGPHADRARALGPATGAAGAASVVDSRDRVPGRRRGVPRGRQQDGLGVRIDLVLISVGMLGVVAGVLLVSPLAIQALARLRDPRPRRATGSRCVTSVAIALDRERRSPRSALALGIAVSIVATAAAAENNAGAGNLSATQLLVHTADQTDPAVPDRGDNRSVPNRSR